MDWGKVEPRIISYAEILRIHRKVGNPFCSKNEVKSNELRALSNENESWYKGSLTFAPKAPQVW
jgi:hypothetical protein